MDEVIQQLFPSRQGIDNLIPEKKRKELNDATEAKWTRTAVHSKRKQLTPQAVTIHFDSITRGDDLDFAIEPYEPFQGISFSGNTFISETSAEPGHVRLRTHSGRTRVGFKALLPIVITGEGLVDLHTMDVAPGNYNGVGLRFEGKDGLGATVQTQDEIIDAETPRTITFTGFNQIKSLEITQYNGGSETLHPENVGNDLRVSLTNITVIPPN